MFSSVSHRVSARVDRCRHRLDQLGQATAEYALVILGAVALATLLLNWARGSHAISRLFDSVIDKILPG